MNQRKLEEYVLTVIEKCIHLNHLKQLQSFLTSVGHSHTNFYAFKLLRFCTLKLTNLHYARSIFNHLHSPNIFIYTALITAYASYPDFHSAFHLFRTMLRRGYPKPDQFIYPHVLRSCHDHHHGARKLGLVHSHVLKSGFTKHPVVETSLVDVYARCGSDVRIARNMFDEMSERNVVSCTAMICGHARVGDIGNAISLFDQMPDRDIPCWNAIIAGCTQNGFFSEAISLFKRMVVDRQHLRPNEVTFVCALSACGNTGMLQLGEWIHGYVYRNGVILNSFLSNALVDMYGKCGSLDKAARVFHKTSKKSLTCWNSLINCYALHGQSNNAIRVFEEMLQLNDINVTPDEVTFMGLLNACTHGGFVEKGRYYFELMTCKYKVEPTMGHYGCLIDILVRSGNFEEALKVVKDMKFEADEVVWGCLLNGCKIHRRSDLAEFAAKKLIEMQPNNGGHWIMLANLYIESGKWDEARQVRQMLEDKNVHKTPGCSWIEVDNQVYQFYSVDKSHPRTDEIYCILEILFYSHYCDTSL